MVITITTKIDTEKHTIKQSTEANILSKTLIKTQDKLIRESLLILGWTPPSTDAEGSTGTEGSRKPYPL